MLGSKKCTENSPGFNLKNAPKLEEREFLPIELTLLMGSQNTNVTGIVLHNSLSSDFMLPVGTAVFQISG